jgi:hypothetical protein
MPEQRKRLLWLTTKSVPISQIAIEFGKSTGWVCRHRRELLDEVPRKNLSIPRGNRADAVMMLLDEEDLHVLRDAAELRGTTLAGLGAAIMKVCAKEPSLIDAILDDEEERE